MIAGLHAKINKEETGPLLRLGEAALLRRDLPSAKRYFEAVLGSNPRSPPAHFYSGYLAWKQALPERAESAFRETLRLLHPPAQPGEVGTREGDTKAGTTPRLVPSPGCHRLEDILSELAVDPVPLATDKMQDYFTTFESTLAQAWARLPR